MQWKHLRVMHVRDLGRWLELKIELAGAQSSHCHRFHQQNLSHFIRNDFLRFKKKLCYNGAVIYKRSKQKIE